jgi:hypothetical protein
MSLFNFFKPSKRVRKIWWSVGATVLGTALLGGWTYWRDARRKTDLTNGSKIEHYRRVAR